MAYLDANVLVRHLTGTPRAQAMRATAFLAKADELRLVDVVVAEAVYVLQSVYRLSRDRVAALMRAVVAHPAVVVEDINVVLRSLSLYRVERLDFVDAYLVAVAESTGDGVVASLDRALDRVPTIERIEP